ncbi:MAG: PH domain-containing protein [Promethearchaeota archaeon]
MGREREEARVIKPPRERITSGRVFKPSSAFRYKECLKVLLFGILIAAVVLFGWWGISTLIIANRDSPEFFVYPEVWWVPLTTGLLFFIIIWSIGGLVFTNMYVSSIEYSVITESGDAMPEVYVQKGILSVTRKHVPFRTITNISTTAGPFDRFFGIGNINIETAGRSGQHGGPEEKLEGCEFYEELRDFILQQLRRFRLPYVTGTEAVHRTEEPIPKLPDSLDDEILWTLREMRDILTEIARKIK